MRTVLGIAVLVIAAWPALGALALAALAGTCELRRNAVALLSLAAVAVTGAGVLAWAGLELIRG